MTLSFEYDHLEPLVFAGVTPDPVSFEDARVVVLPVPLDRTTSYASGTRNGPRDLIDASTHMELYDEELRLEPYRIGLFTLPSMEFPLEGLDETMDEIERVAGEVLARDKFLVTIGGEHSITGPIVAAHARRHPRLNVLQIDAHSDLRDTYMGTRFNHACAMRRVLDSADRCVQVGIRAVSEEEASALPGLRTRVFYDVDMREAPEWMDRVVDALADPVYITIDLDGLEPGLMPAVGTPEPGGLSWYEILGLLRKVIARRQVVGFDVVELCPIPGLLAPNFVAAKLVYKLIGYRFADVLRRP